MTPAKKAPAAKAPAKRAVEAGEGAGPGGQGRRPKAPAKAKAPTPAAKAAADRQGRREGPGQGAGGDEGRPRPAGAKAAAQGPGRRRPAKARRRRRDRGGRPRAKRRRSVRTRPTPSSWRSSGRCSISERAVYQEQAADLKAEADSLAQEREPGDVQFDEESGEGGTVTVDRERDLALSAQALAAVEEIDDALVRIADEDLRRLRALPPADPEGPAAGPAVRPALRGLQERGAVAALSERGGRRPPGAPTAGRRPWPSPLVTRSWWSRRPGHQVAGAWPTFTARCTSSGPSGSPSATTRAPPSASSPGRRRPSWPSRSCSSACSSWLAWRAPVDARSRRPSGWCSAARSATWPTGCSAATTARSSTSSRSRHWPTFNVADACITVGRGRCSSCS